jgi:hypothetical protein
MQYELLDTGVFDEDRYFDVFVEYAKQAPSDMLIHLRRRPELLTSIHATGPGHFGVADRGLFALVNEDRLRRVLSRMLDEMNS